MRHIPEILAAAMLVGAVITILLEFKARLLAPLRSRKNAAVYTLIVATGEAEGLEECVRGAELLRECGRCDAALIILKDALTPSGEARAERTAQRGGVELFTKDSLWEVLPQ